jgi:hypothetical protein
MQRTTGCSSTRAASEGGAGVVDGADIYVPT